MRNLGTEQTEKHDINRIKASRLHFKRGKGGKSHTRSQIKDEKTREIEKLGDEVETGGNREEDAHSELITPGRKKKRKIRLTEYGRAINGYRFVATVDAEAKAFDREEQMRDLGLSDEEKRDIGLSDEEKREFEFSDKKREYEFSDKKREYELSDEEKREFEMAGSDGWKSYDEYSRKWDQILRIQDIAESIPLPVASNGLEDVNETRVRQFLDTQDKIKRERIRWHPDKMMVRLEKLGVDQDTCPGYKSVVTQVFQTINQIHDV